MSIADVQPLHVGTCVELLRRELSAPTAKQRLAAIRMLFDWFVIGQIVPVNPAGVCARPASCHHNLEAYLRADLGARSLGRAISDRLSTDR